MNSTTPEPFRSQAVVIVETIIVTAVTLMIVFGNFVTILVLRSAECWDDNACLLLQNLALADFGVGIFLTWTAIYSSASNLEEWPYGDFMCQLSSFLGDVCCAVSILTLALISVERYLLLVKPLKYPRYMTQNSVFFLSALTWIITSMFFVTTFLPNGTVYNINSFLCSFNFADHLWFSVTLICVVFLPSNMTILFTYTSIIRTARRHRQQIRAQHEALSSCLVQQHNFKAINTLLIITGTFNLAWAPYTVLAVSRSFVGDLPHWVEFLLPWLAMSNSFANIIIYLVFNPPFRKQAQKLFVQKIFRLRGSNQVSPVNDKT